jgi:hypothetical protein
MDKLVVAGGTTDFRTARNLFQALVALGTLEDPSRQLHIPNISITLQLSIRNGVVW